MSARGAVQGRWETLNTAYKSKDYIHEKQIINIQYIMT